MAYSKALIVDDSKLARITLKRKLESQGLQVVLAESGKQAIAVVESEQPDIVFMDHLMPEMDGFEATQTLRANPSYANLPIIMCTGKDHSGYLEEAKAIGANQILSKPPVDEALLAILATDFSAEVAVLHVEPQAEELAAVASAAEVAKAAELDASLGAQAPILDMDMLGGDAVVSSDALGDESFATSPSNRITDTLDIGSNVYDASARSSAPSATKSAGVDEAQLNQIVDRLKQEQSLALEQNAQVYKAEIASLKSELETLKGLAAQAPAATASADAGEIKALCQGFFEQERISLVAEVLASVPEPQMPDFDVPKVDYERVERQLSTAKSELELFVDERIKTSQSQLVGKVEALLQDKLSAVKPGLSVDEVKAMIAASASSQGVEEAKQLAEKLTRFEKTVGAKLEHNEQALVQHIEAVQATTEGMLDEALSQGSNKEADSDELDILKFKQNQLAEKIEQPKQMAIAAIILGVAALAAAVVAML